MDQNSSLGERFDLNSESGVSIVLASIRASDISSVKKNELRDLVFQYTNRGGDVAVKAELENKLSSYEIKPIQLAAEFKVQNIVFPFGSARPAPVFKAVSNKKTTTETDVVKTKTDKIENKEADNTEQIVDNKKTETVQESKVDAPQPKSVNENKVVEAPLETAVFEEKTVSTETQNPTPTPTSQPSVAVEQNSKAVPQSGYSSEPPTPTNNPKPVSQTIASAETNTPKTESNLKGLDRIREIKQAVNAKVGNPVNLIDIDNNVGREYMAALLDAMKKLNQGNASEFEIAMQRLEVAYDAVETAVAKNKAVPNNKFETTTPAPVTSAPAEQKVSPSAPAPTSTSTSTPVQTTSPEVNSTPVSVSPAENSLVSEQGAQNNTPLTKPQSLEKNETINQTSQTSQAPKTGFSSLATEPDKPQSVTPEKPKSEVVVEANKVAVSNLVTPKVPETPSVPQPAGDFSVDNNVPNSQASSTVPTTAPAPVSAPVVAEQSNLVKSQQLNSQPIATSPELKTEPVTPKTSAETIAEPAPTPASVPTPTPTPAPQTNIGYSNLASSLDETQVQKVAPVENTVSATPSTPATIPPVQATPNVVPVSTPTPTLIKSVSDLTPKSVAEPSAETPASVWPAKPETPPAPTAPVAPAQVAPQPEKESLSDIATSFASKLASNLGFNKNESDAPTAPPQSIPIKTPQSVQSASVAQPLSAQVAPLSSVSEPQPATPEVNQVPPLSQKKELLTPEDLPESKQDLTSAENVPLYSAEIDYGLEQLLMDWTLFNKSGMFGTGPKGREHPLFKKIANLEIPVILAGRFEGATQEVKQSITDYMNGWRYEQGIIYEQGEKFEDYLRRVIKHILDLQRKQRKA